MSDVESYREVPYSCEQCEHYLSKGACRAFDRIPLRFFSDAEQHSKVVKGQNGDFVFSTTDEREVVYVNPVPAT